MVPRECKLSYLTFTMTVHQIQQQTLKWAGLMSLAIVEKKKKSQSRFHKSAAQTRFPASWHSSRKIFTEQINHLIRCSAFSAETRICQRSQKSVKVLHDQSFTNIWTTDLFKKFQNFKPNGTEHSAGLDWNTLNRDSAEPGLEGSIFTYFGTDYLP